MPPVYRIVTRIQDQDDFSGSLTNGYYLKYDSGSGTFTLAAVDLSAYAPLAGASFTGAVIVDSDAASAFAVGPNGDTNPAFRVVGNVSSAATGLSVTGNAAGSGVTLTVLSSGTNENLVLTPKGTTGRVSIVDNSSAAIPALVFSAGTSVGFNYFANGWLFFGGGGVDYPIHLTSNVRLVAASQFAWTSNTTDASNASDTGLARSSAGVVKVTNGSTGTGSLIATQLAAAAPASGAGNSLTLAGSAAVSGNTNGGDTVVQLAAKSGSGADGKFVVKAATASPGGNLTEWQDNSDTALTAITSSFGVYIRNSAGTQSTTVSPAAIAFGVSDGTGLTNPGSSAQGSYAVTPNGRGFGVTYGTSLTNSPSSGIGVAIDAAWAGVVVKNVNTSGYAIRVESGTSLFEAAVLSRTLVEANTAGSGSPNVLTAAESGTLLTNEGATAQNYHTLPSAAAGLQFDFVVQDSDGMRIVAATGDTIRNVATVSATAGYIQSTVVGSTLTLKAINATEWVVTAIQGTWTIDS